MNQKGFAPIAIILIAVGVLAVAGGIYWWEKGKNITQAPAPIANTATSSVIGESTNQIEIEYGCPDKCTKVVLKKGDDFNYMIAIKENSNIETKTFMGNLGSEDAFDSSSDKEIKFIYNDSTTYCSTYAGDSNYLQSCASRKSLFQPNYINIIPIEKRTGPWDRPAPVVVIGKIISVEKGNIAVRVDQVILFFQ